MGACAASGDMGHGQSAIALPESPVSPDSQESGGFARPCCNARCARHDLSVDGDDQALVFVDDTTVIKPTTSAAVGSSGPVDRSPVDKASVSTLEVPMMMRTSTTSRAPGGDMGPTHSTLQIVGDEMVVMTSTGMQGVMRRTSTSKEHQRAFVVKGLGSFASLNGSMQSFENAKIEPAVEPERPKPLGKVQFNSNPLTSGSRNSGDAAHGKPTQLATMDVRTMNHEDDDKLVREDTAKDMGTASSSVVFLNDLRRTPSHALRICIENLKDIDEVYKVENAVLGKGAFGSVKKARVRATDGVRAVKFVSKARMKGKEFLLQNEISILKSIDHPNLIKLYELFEDAEQIYMVMELCAGGALVDHLKRSGRFTEKEAARSMVQILRGIYYLHQHDICHRDMKPANCLIVARDLVERSTLRITDFGLSCRATEHEVMTDRVGTLAFMSPQVIARKYDRTCDTWSCGVTMYMLLCGRTPFGAKTDEEVRAKVTAGVFSFDAEAWVDCSEDCMTLIRGMLKVSPKVRMSVKDCLSCTWLRTKAHEAEPQFALDMSILMNLQGFRSLNKFKRAALCIIASMLDEEQTKDQRDMFIMLDTDDDGTLDHEELRIRLMTEDGDTMEMDLGKGRSSSICEGDQPACYTYTEFLAATFNRTMYCQKNICWAAFNTFDADGNGYIDRKELVKGWVLGALDDAEVQRLVQEFDADGNGTIDFQEFMEMMRDGEGWTPSVRSPRTPMANSRTNPDSPRPDSSRGHKPDSARRSDGSKVSSTADRRQRRQSVPSLSSTHAPDSSQPYWKSDGTGTGSFDSSPRSTLGSGRRASNEPLRQSQPKARRNSVSASSGAQDSNLQSSNLPLSPLMEYMNKPQEAAPAPQEKRRKSSAGLSLLQGLKPGRKK